MRRVLGSGGLLALLLWVGVTGCNNRQVVREKPLPDPLLTSKKPIEGKSNLSLSDVGYREEIPSPPRQPFETGVTTSLSDPPIVKLLPDRR